MATIAGSWVIGERAGRKTGTKKTQDCYRIEAIPCIHFFLGRIFSETQDGLEVPSSVSSTSGF